MSTVKLSFTPPVIVTGAVTADDPVWVTPADACVTLSVWAPSASPPPPPKVATPSAAPPDDTSSGPLATVADSAATDPDDTTDDDVARRLTVKVMLPPRAPVAVVAV